MYLFLIMTPAQLMNAIVLRKTVFKDIKCDAYMTSNLDKYRDSLENSNVFNKVYSYELLPDITGRQNAFKRMFVRIKNALDVKKIPAMMPSDAKSYECIFASGVSLRNYEIYYAFKKVNPSLRIALYEEGICEYYILSQNSGFKKAFSHFFFNSYYLEDCRELYVYEPSIVKSAWDNIEIKAIPKFYDKPELMDTLNAVFGFNTDETLVYLNKVVFLESCYDDDLASEKYQLELLDKVVESVGYENVIVKMHPRSPVDKYPDRFKIVFSNIPFEILAVNMDLDKCAFVSTCTSAIVNPKLILDKEPVVVCLDRLNDKELNESDYFFDRVANIYETKCFFIPESDDQYKAALETINERLELKI